jgi:hypothetical protein
MKRILVKFKKEVWRTNFWVDQKVFDDNRDILEEVKATTSLGYFPEDGFDLLKKKQNEPIIVHLIGQTEKHFQVSPDTYGKCQYLLVVSNNQDITNTECLNATQVRFKYEKSK